jgi:hypothetical protein
VPRSLVSRARRRTEAGGHQEAIDRDGHQEAIDRDGHQEAIDRDGHQEAIDRDGHQDRRLVHYNEKVYYLFAIMK